MNRRGVSTLEITIVSIVLVLLAALIAPQVLKSGHNSRLNQTTFKLQTLRTAITKFERQNGAPPESLEVLTRTPSEEHPLLESIPTEGLTGSTDVLVIDGEAAISLGGEVNVGGWIYNRTTGEVRVHLGSHRDL